jgi:hypothetical protein
MDWIEQLFGISPDGGDGTIEAMIVFAACIVVGAVISLGAPSVRAYLGHLLGFRSRT